MSLNRELFTNFMHKAPDQSDVNTRNSSHFFINNLNKKNMLKKVLTVIGAMAVFSAAHSRDSTKGTTTLTYSVDGLNFRQFDNY